MVPVEHLNLNELPQDFQDFLKNKLVSEKLSPFAEWAALSCVYRRGFFNEFRAMPYTPTALNFGAVVSASAEAGPEAGPSTPTQGTTVKTEMPSAGTKMDPVDCDDLRGDRYGKPHILDFDSLDSLDMAVGLSSSS